MDTTSYADLQVIALAINPAQPTAKNKFDAVITVKNRGNSTLNNAGYMEV
jgi:hypothetical protein